ncbi:GrpB family protein [Nocardioides sp. JQ2195]|uniref:GrpB family protein n=1 Tax=Nocardioides sp. JQ2195 TaxID=2592334 RepID=UPI001F0E50ED|nr:GrpB family protein [Nocardioides sp. JQ2195]
MSYFQRLGPSTFRATEHVSGAWDIETQHIAPALGLLAHALELDHAARRPGDRLRINRLSYDILGTLPVDVVDIEIEVLRPGRTIELVQATLSHDGRAGVILRAWFLQPGSTADIAGGALPGLPGPDEMAPWDAGAVWQGGFIASADVRRDPIEPGRGRYWVRTPLALVEGEVTSRLAAFAGLFDIANGMNVRADPGEVAFPNVDLTAHLFRQPRGEWVGFDTTVSFGVTGVGLTSSTLHDVHGPIGTLAQVLTVRPNAATPIEVVAHDDSWSDQFECVAAELHAGLEGIASEVEHVGSTSVPGLAAKPVLDIDVVVDADDVSRAIRAMEDLGYQHRGDLGVKDREAFFAPDADPRRNVYLCTAGTLGVRNHLAVRDVLRRRADLRDAYAAVKRQLADHPDMDIETYTARKSLVLQEVLAESDLTAEELREIHRLNDPDA